MRPFSPWSERIDQTAADLLTGAGWTAPNPDRYPTGADLAKTYLQPLADLLGQAVR